MTKKAKKPEFVDWDHVAYSFISAGIGMVLIVVIVGDYDSITIPLTPIFSGLMILLFSSLAKYAEK